MSDSLGVRLAGAIATKDETALRALLADDIDFRGLTPRRAWEGSTPDEVVDAVLGHWFEASDRVVGIGHVTDGETVADTAQVSYRFDLDNAEGQHVAEQQAYYRSTGDDDRIGYLRVLCSGFRPRATAR